MIGETKASMDSFKLTLFPRISSLIHLVIQIYLSSVFRNMNNSSDYRIRYGILISGYLQSILTANLD